MWYCWFLKIKITIKKVSEDKNIILEGCGYKVDDFN